MLYYNLITIGQIKTTYDKHLSLEEIQPAPLSKRIFFCVICLIPSGLSLLVNSVCLHVLGKWVGPLLVLSWWPWHALCLFSPFITAALRVPPHRPQLLHLFQLARVRGGAQRSITQAQSRRCTYSIANSWQTGVTPCLLGGALSEVRVWGCHCNKEAAKCVCGMLRPFGHSDRHSGIILISETQKHTHASTFAHLLISSTLTHSHWDRTSLLYQCVVVWECVCAMHHCGLTVNVSPWALFWCSSTAEYGAPW